MSASFRVGLSQFRLSERVCVLAPSPAGSLEGLAISQPVAKLAEPTWRMTCDRLPPFSRSRVAFHRRLHAEEMSPRRVERKPTKSTKTCQARITVPRKHAERTQLAADDIEPLVADGRSTIPAVVVLARMVPVAAAKADRIMPSRSERGQHPLACGVSLWGTLRLRNACGLCPNLPPTPASRLTL